MDVSVYIYIYIYTSPKITFVGSVLYVDLRTANPNSSRPASIRSAYDYSHTRFSDSYNLSPSEWAKELLPTPTRSEVYCHSTFSPHRTSVICRNRPAKPKIKRENSSPLCAWKRTGDGQWIPMHTKQHHQTRSMSLDHPIHRPKPFDAFA